MAARPRRRRARGALLALLAVPALTVPALAARPAAGQGSNPAGRGVQDPAVEDPASGDPAVELQWALDRIGAPEAWRRATGRGVTIAVIDSGADLDHQDLAGRIAGSVSCIDAGGDPGRCRGTGRDDNGHGTHVAGIAAAARGNGVGVAGVAPDASLLVVRVLANQCRGDTCAAAGKSSDVVAGIRWAVRNGADIVNLSLGGGAITNVLGCPFCQAVEEAWDQGVIPVVAAGNDDLLPPEFGDTPAIVVTATDRDDRPSSYSNAASGLLTEARWPVAAPGGEGELDEDECRIDGSPRGILSTYWFEGTEDAYACLAGTSMAAPHVSGGLALLLEQGYTPRGAVERLLATADDLGPLGRDATFGVGRINLARAVEAGPVTVPSTTTAPDPTTATTAPATAGGAAPTTTGAPGTEGTPTTATGDTASDAAGEPRATLPDTTAAAPLDASSGSQDAPAWLVGLAAVAALASGTATSMWASHRARLRAGAVQPVRTARRTW